MEIKFTFGTPVKTTGTVSLDKMISRLLYAFQPTAVRKNSFFINYVPINFIVDANKNMLAAVISELLSSVVHKTKNSCIHISAKRYSDIVLFKVRDSQPGNDVFECNWREINPLVEKLGGCITTSETHYNSSTITFSFRSLANVA